VDFDCDVFHPEQYRDEFLAKVIVLSFRKPLRDGETDARMIAQCQWRWQACTANEIIYMRVYKSFCPADAIKDNIANRHAVATPRTLAHKLEQSIQ